MNPPGISLGIYAVLMMLSIYAVDRAIQESSVLWIEKAYMAVSKMGRHTLYIFLYHCLFLHYMIPILDQNGMIPANIWMKRISYFLIMIIGSIAIEYVLKGIRHLAKW